MILYHTSDRENAVVNEYEFDETGLAVHRFSRSPEWFRYIFQNGEGRGAAPMDPRGTDRKA